MPVFEPICAAGYALQKALGVCALVVSLCGSALAQTPLVLATPDDNPARNEQLSHLLPHEVRIVVDPASSTEPGTNTLSGASAAIARAAFAGWDIIALDEASEIAACGAGMLEKASTVWNARFDLSEMFALRPGHSRGKSACVLTYDTRFEALAYRLDAFPLSPPETGFAVFDTVAFPGLRAVAWPPRALLEWAILGQGVPEVQVYDILSSKRGMQLAREAILDIAPNIVWVGSDAEAVRLLVAGEVSMVVASTAELASVASTGVVVLQAGQIGLRRSWVEVPNGRAMSNMQRPTDALVAALAGDVNTHVPALWRDAAWYARADAHVGIGLAGLGPKKDAKVDDALSAVPPVFQSPLSTTRFDRSLSHGLRTGAGHDKN